MQFIPSVLTHSRDEYDDLMAQILGVERVHLDFIDKSYSDDPTILPAETHLDDFKEFKFDAHIQVATENMMDIVEQSIAAGCDRIIGHIEDISNFSEYCKVVERSQKEIGIGIDLSTDIPAEEYLKKISVVMVMSVKAGKGGQEFNETALDKIKRLAVLRVENNFDYEICVDGGVTPDNINSIAEAGADEVSVGRRLFKGEMKDNILKYQEALYGR